jgi:hypothetical protein
VPSRGSARSVTTLRCADRTVRQGRLPCLLGPAGPWDRDGSFEPQIVRKWQRRLTGVDEMVPPLYAKGLTGLVRAG